MPKIDWSMVSAMAACVGVTVALVYYTKNLQLTRLSNSAKMIHDLVGNFNSREMREHRSRFASALLREAPAIDLRRDAPVLDFFEEVGYMTRRKMLDRGMVWNSFFWWLEPYYLAAKAQIITARTNAEVPSLFIEIEWLFDRMCEVTKQEEGREYAAPSEAYITEFLNDEAALVTPS